MNRERQSGFRRALLALAVVGALLVPVAALEALPKRTSKQERYKIAKRQLERAHQLRSDLEGTPRAKRTEKAYLKIASTYRRVYDIAPFSGLSADALTARAEIYHDMGNLFGRSYWKKSIEVYRFLRREYPKSRYRDSALFNIAQIQHVHLKQFDEAAESYQYLLKRYPTSEFVPKAGKALASLKRKAQAKRQAAQQAKKKATERAQAKTPTKAGPKTTKVSAGKPVPPVIQPTGERAIIRNIRYWNTKGYTRVVVDLDKAVQFQEARVSNPDRIFFDLFNTELSEILNGKEFLVREGLLNRIRVAENRSGVTRVVLEVNGVKDYSVFTLPNPFRLVVDVRSTAPAPSRTTKVASRPPSPKPEKKTAAARLPSGASPVGCTARLTLAGVPKPARDGNHTLTRALGLKVSRIVLDPGHDGDDFGASGPTGLREKDLVLNVAKRLAKRLEKELCAEVIFTRDSDRFVPLENRTALANQKQADLFISIHANYSRNRRVRGIETYYLNFTSDPEALEVAARENALSQQSMHDLQDIIKKISRNEKINESRELADNLQVHLHKRLRRYSKRIKNRGVKKAPFVVLIGANMPSVLAEISFISNRSDEKHLKSQRGRDRIVEGLFNGIAQYLKDINGLSVAQATD